MKKILESIWPSILWTITVFILLSMPMEKSKATSILDLIEFDKLVHLILFAGLTFLWAEYLCYKSNNKHVFIIIFLIIVASGFGLGMEFYQKYFTERNFSMIDAIADTFGAIIGTSMAKKSPYGNRGRNQN
jgi:VanZ family protein